MDNHAILVLFDRLIAQLGGFLARKSDGEPGVKTIWQGLQRVMDVAKALQSMREGISRIRAWRARAARQMSPGT